MSHQAQLGASCFAAPPPPPPATPSTQATDPQRKKKDFFIFGLGYTGLAVAKELRECGHNVAGTTRSQESAEKATAAGIPAWPVEGELSLDLYDRIAGASHILCTVTPTPEGDPVLHQFREQIAACKAAWIGYLSSTSVYGDHNGAWVDEESPSINVGEKGKARLAAEAQWEQLARQSQKAIAVMRLSAIYGPGRSALTTLRRNPNTIRDIGDYAHKEVSRMHIDDIVAGVMHVIARSNQAISQMADISTPTRFNFADDMPATAGQVYSFAEELLRAAQDEIFLNQRTDTERRVTPRYTDRKNKRVSNSKLKQVLLPQLKYPTYKEGLEAVAKHILQ